MERRGGGTVGGDADVETMESRRLSSPSTLPGDAGVLSVLGFFGIGGAGLRWVEETEDIERDRTDGEYTEGVTDGTSMG
jgi:hypothetical protein